MKKNLTVTEAACIITGTGIGGGVLAIPAIAAKTGILSFVLILALAYFGSWLMHMMIAQAVCRGGAGSQILSIFSRYLFKGKAGKALTILFFILMGFVLIANLTAYVVGGGEILTALFPISEFVGRLIFYIVAAAVVFFGLKALGICEKYSVLVIFLLIGGLGIATFIRVHGSLPIATGSFQSALSLFAMIMLAFSAFFSVPQAVEGLNGDLKKVRKAITLGLGYNLLLIVLVTVCSLWASEEVTEVAMVGWAKGIGGIATIIGNLFTLLAMLTSYWSVSLALSDIIREQFAFNHRLCWLIATLPSLLLAILTNVGFVDALELAGGAIAIFIALLVIPTYRRSAKDADPSEHRWFEKTIFQIFAALAYVLMAVGSLL